jgi:hypothetical protein
METLTCGETPEFGAATIGIGGTKTIYCSNMPKVSVFSGR